MPNLLFFSVLMFFGSPVTPPTCPNQLKPEYQRLAGTRIEFSVRITAQSAYGYVLFRDCNGSLEKVKSGTGRGNQQIEFVQPFTKDCKYRVTFEFEGETAITCKSKSIEFNP
jgi:hypothetical protein